MMRTRASGHSVTAGVSALAAAAFIVLASPDASACAWTEHGPSRAWPPNGSKNVSRATSVFVLGHTASNDELTLTANGSPVALSFTEVGHLYSTEGKVFRAELPDVLEPSTEYVLTGPTYFGSSQFGEPSTPVELTRFTTAAAYDKAPGTPPSVSSLELWSVRYPLKDVSSGNCVFAEYQGYAALTFEPAQIPNTTAQGTLYTLTIAPATGGSSQSLLFSGDVPFTGHELSTENPYPLSLAAEWLLDLDPRREYCATLSARGDGDNARPALTSQPVCASVAEVCAKGADCGGEGAAADAGGGCTMARGLESFRSASILLLALAFALARPLTNRGSRT